MNKSHVFGYLLGLLIFVIGIPALMWLVSGRPWIYVPESTLLYIVSIILAVYGLTLSIYIYDAGVLVWLWSALPLLIVLAEVILLTLQVRSEEKRLAQDFGQEYLDYKNRVGRYFF